MQPQLPPSLPFQKGFTHTQKDSIESLSFYQKLKKTYSLKPASKKNANGPQDYSLKRRVSSIFTKKKSPTRAASMQVLYSHRIQEISSKPCSTEHSLYGFVKKFKKNPVGPIELEGVEHERLQRKNCISRPALDTEQSDETLVSDGKEALVKDSEVALFLKYVPRKKD